MHRSLDGSLIHVEPDHDVRAQGCQVTGILLEKWNADSYLLKRINHLSSPATETPALRNPSPPYTNYMCGTSPLVNNTIPLSEVHNLATSTFRSLYSLVCALPTSRVCRRARTRLISGLDVAVCISDEFPGSGGTIWGIISIWHPRLRDADPNRPWSVCDRNADQRTSSRGRKNYSGGDRMKMNFKLRHRST